MIVNCLQCHNEFKTFPAWIRKRNSTGGRFCSRKCSGEYHAISSVKSMMYAKEVLKRNGITVGGRPIKRVKIECAICFIEFEVPYSQRDRKTCSIACRSKLSKPIRIGFKSPSTTGINHYNWKGGRSIDKRNCAEYRYWRTAVFLRDNYTCVQCGLTSGNGKRVNLQADHIKPVALFPELIYNIENGRTLCVDCHRKTPTYGMNKRYVKMDPGEQSEINY